MLRPFRASVPIPGGLSQVARFFPSSPFTSPRPLHLCVSVFNFFFSVRSVSSVLSVLILPETSVPDTAVLRTSCSYNRIRSHGRESAPSVTPASRKIRATVAAISGAPGVSP